MVDSKGNYKFDLGVKGLITNRTNWTPLGPINIINWIPLGPVIIFYWCFTYFHTPIFILSASIKV